MTRKSNSGKLTSSSVEAFSKHDLFIIDDETINDPSLRDYIYCPVIEGEVRGHGLVPRDYATHPKEMFAPVSDLKLIDPSEYDERIALQEKEESSLEHLCTWESLDQNGQGYCWAYSSTGCVMALRSIMNLPPLRLSAHAVAWKIKGGRDEGGWCGLSAKFIKETGVPSVELWPEKSMSRSNDRPETWTNAKLHLVTEDWQDIGGSLYDQNLSLRQLDTCLLLNIPVATDFNWWGHSVMMGRLVKVESGSYGRAIRNSWSQSWGKKGWSILRGNKAIPDSSIALRVTKPSVN